MKFRELSQYLEELEKTASRNKMIEILAEVFKKAKAEDIDKITYLLSGYLAPKYEGIVFNLAERMMLKILSQAYGKEAKEVRKLYKKQGDLGDVAESLASGRGKGLTASQVYERMLEVAHEEGVGSQERKVSKMAKLLSSLDPLSARFVARIPVGRLRLGFSDMTILDALSVMLKGDKSARPQLEAAFNVTADIGKVARRAKRKGLAGLTKISIEPGTPIRPSLAERLPSAEKILEKVGDKVAVEGKYDGLRSQVHLYKQKGKRQVKIFSRNLDNITYMFPDLVEAVKKIKVKSAILDSEAIGYDPKTDKFLPFQETVQRKRKHEVEEMAKKFPLKLFVFDILYKNGKSLLDKPFGERRKILEKTLKGAQDGIKVIKQDVVSSPAQMTRLVKLYLGEGLEGALIKKIDAPYKAGARGYHWVKYKKTTEEGVADTIDCVVMGTYRGRGKRAGFGLGAFLVGVREGDKFKTVSKIGTGLSDEQWKELNSWSKKLEVKKQPKGYLVDKNLIPDSWLKPALVVEIMADEITRSPVHTAGAKKEKKGYALRFPRLVRFRDEKNPEQATTVKEVEKLFKMQGKKK